MNNNKLLPSFFVVGGQKCGTTTLHNWLNQERFISLPEYKETHYFSRDYSKGINWYLNQFTNNDYNKFWYMTATIETPYEWWANYHLDSYRWHTSFHFERSDNPNPQNLLHRIKTGTIVITEIITVRYR